MSVRRCRDKNHFYITRPRSGTLFYAMPLVIHHNHKNDEKYNHSNNGLVLESINFMAGRQCNETTSNETKRGFVPCNLLK